MNCAIHRSPKHSKQRKDRFPFFKRRVGTCLAKGGSAELEDLEWRLAHNERITTLVFNSHHRYMYNAQATAAYLNILAQSESFKYVVFLDTGKYQGWMLASKFMALVQTKGGEVMEWINDGDFGRLQLNGMHTEKVDSTESAEEALELLKRTGKEGIAVIDSSQALVGIASRDGITSKILNKIIAKNAITR